MISIIIPTLNEQKTIVDAIKQFDDVSSVDLEIIVTDGGSTDKTVALARSINSLTHSVTIVEFPKDKQQTIASNRNFGASFAKGDLLLFLDADTRLNNPQDFLEKVQILFKTQSRLSGLIPQLKIYPHVKTLIGRLIFSEINFNFWIMNNVFRTGGAMAKCQIVRASAFQAIKGYREDLAATEDMDLFFRLAKYSKTQINFSLIAYHSARRPLAWGWLKWLWIINQDFVFYKFRNKIVSQEWTPVR